MAVVGAYARIDVSDPQAVRTRLAALSGVTLFDLGDPGKVGVLIEADSIDDAHRTLCAEVEKVEGVWGVWPVYAHMEPESADADRSEPN